MRMQDRNSSNGPLLHVHYKYMRNEGAPAHYYDCAIDAKDAWAGFANVTDGGCNQLIPTEMNISFRFSEDVWSSMGFSPFVLGFTWIVDSDGNSIVDEYDCIYSSGIIDYSIIYMNPTGDIFYHETDDLTVVLNRIQKTMVHEIGHAMGLGHPDRDSYSPIADTTFSVMRQGFPDEVNSGTVPQAHERIDLNSMYGLGGAQ